MKHRKHHSDDQARSRKPARAGDVLGISDTTAGAARPAFVRPGGHPEGIDVRTPRTLATGFDDVPQRSGSASVDMGGGGEGTNVAPPAERRPAREEPEDE
jgi:hypothetical protein